MLDVLRRRKVDGDGGVVEDALLLLLAAAALHHARLLGMGFSIIFEFIMRINTSLSILWSLQ